MADLQEEESKVRFYITMNMPARSGISIHQIVGDHPSTSLEEFHDVLNDCDFIIVEEFYRNQEGGYYSVGNIILSTMHIGKVKGSEK